MGILQTLAEMEPQSAIITLGDVRLKVGESDRDAARMLIAFLDKFADGQHTNGEAEAILLENWMKAVLDHSDALAAAGAEPPQDLLEEPRVRALWDAIFWFRFLTALAPSVLTSVPADSPTLAAADGTESTSASG